MHRFDLQDWQWELIAGLFPSNDGKPGEPWEGHRTVMNGMFHVLHTGCPWRDLPERYGKCRTAYDRFNRYRKDGTFDAILKRLRAGLDKLGRIDWDFWCASTAPASAPPRAPPGPKKVRRGRPRAAAGAGSGASCT